MEDMNARVMENEELDEVTEVDEAVESGNAGALVAGVVGGFLAYAMIGGVKKLWGFVGTKLAERKKPRPKWWTRSTPKSLRRIPTRKILRSNRARGSPKGEYL